MLESAATADSLHASASPPNQTSLYHDGGDEIREGGLEIGLLSKKLSVIAERPRESGRYRRIYSDDDSESALIDAVVSTLAARTLVVARYDGRGNSNPGL